MRIEHGFDLFGVERAVGGFDALCLAATEPQPALAIEPAHVAHAMHDALATVGQRFADLGDARGRIAAEIGIGGGGTGDGDFADFAIGHFVDVVPVGDRRIDDADDADLVRRHGTTDAGAGAGLGGGARGFQFTAFDDGNGQAFGGAVRRPELRAVRQQGADLRHGVRRHRRTGGGHALHGGQRRAVVGQHLHQRRRTEQLGDAETRDGRVQLVRIGIRGPGGVHVGNHRGEPQRRIEQRERRERRQVHAAGLQAEGVAQQLDLGDEMTMAVHHALRHAGGAAGEQDAGDIVGRRVRELRARPGAAHLDLRQRGATPGPARADSHDLLRRLRPAQHAARELGQRDADEGFGLGFVQALLQRAAVDAGVDQYRNGAGLEQREHQQEELRRGPHHHHRAAAAADAVGAQTGRDGIAAGIELRVGELAGVAAGAVGAAHGHAVGLLAGQPGQAGGDVARIGHAGIVAAGWYLRQPAALAECASRPRPAASPPRCIPA